jgi:hypothetical protein
MSGRLRWLLCFAVLLLIGCSSGYDVGPPPKSAAAPKVSTQPAGTPTQSSAPQPGPGPATSRSPAPAAGTPPGQTLPIRLATGVALPQTLPDGTAMSFSVDYKFTAGQPEPSVQYFWVIERAQGVPTKQPVRLNAQGTLQGFTDFRPEQGPFQTHLEDAHGNRLSANEPLR